MPIQKECILICQQWNGKGNFLFENRAYFKGAT